MHEISLLRDLLEKVLRVAREQGNARVKDVRIQVGALAHISPEHLREHFVAAARGTAAEGATIHTQVTSDVNEPHAQDIVLDSVELEVEDTASA